MTTQEFLKAIYINYLKYNPWLIVWIKYFKMLMKKPGNKAQMKVCYYSKVRVAWNNIILKKTIKREYKIWTLADMNEYMKKIYNYQERN